jgi:hypothetical protein
LLGFALVIAVAASVAMTASGFLVRDGQAGAMATSREVPSAMATVSASADAEVSLPRPTPPGNVYVGLLTDFCDLGACCLAIAVQDTLYSLHLPPTYELDDTPEGYELSDPEGAPVARQGDTVSVEGDEAGPDSCWATIIDHSLEVVSISSPQPPVGSGDRFGGQLVALHEVDCPGLEGMRC